MNYDGCAPSSSPSVSSLPTLSGSPSSIPSSSSLPTSSSSPSSSPTASVAPSAVPPSQVCFHKGQKIKIEANTQETIQVFEVQVLSENINVALDKIATQSSTFRGNDDKFGANKAVDGDPDTFIHTDDTSSWWMVDLGASISVESINPSAS